MGLSNLEWVYQTRVAIEDYSAQCSCWVCDCGLGLCCFHMGMSAMWESTACQNLPVLHIYIWPTRSKLAYSYTQNLSLSGTHRRIFKFKTTCVTPYRDAGYCRSCNAKKWYESGLVKLFWADTLRGGALAGKTFCLYCLETNPAAGENCLHFSTFKSFLKILRIEGKSLANTVGVFSMLPSPSKCHIRQKSRKSTILTIKSKSP